MKNYQESIMEVLQELDTCDLVRMWNDFCEEDSRMDDYIYLMEEFDDIMAGKEPWEIARACFYGHEFCPAHDYFWFNGYGNLESADFPCEELESCPIYLSEMAAYIMDNDEDFDNDELREVLDEMTMELDEDEEEEEDE